MPHPIQEWIFIIKRYFVTSSYARVRENFQERFPDSKPPIDSTIKRLVDKFHDTGSVTNKEKNRRMSKEAIFSISYKIARNKFFQ